MKRGGSGQTTQEAADMTAIVLPDIDRSTLDELKKRIPDLSEIELPNLPSRKEVGRAAKDVRETADETIDRLLGRSRAPVWPWIAAGIGLVALAGIVAAWFAWFRRPAWETPAEPWTADTYDIEETIVTTPIEPAPGSSRSSTGRGRGGASSTTSTDQSTADTVGSAPYPIEEA
jgi:hypothetical protein